jgi:hypothetical protein
VEPSFVGDAGGVAAKGEAVFGHGNVEQLGELVAGAAAPRPSADRAVLRSFRRVPKRIVLDIDDIFDRVRC